MGRTHIGLEHRGAAPDPGAPFGPGKMLGEKPRRDPIAGLAEFVDADHLDEPGLHQRVERVEVLLADFSHAAIVANAGHQIMIARPTGKYSLGAPGYENGGE